MTQVLRAPLVAAAAAAIAIAFVNRIAPICGLVLALGLTMACAWLALASIDEHLDDTESRKAEAA